MATPIELAIVELQVVIRALHRRLGEIERRLGITPEEFAQRGHREAPVYTPVGVERRVPSVQRTAAGTSDPYEIAGAHTGTATATAAASDSPSQGSPPPDNTLQVNLSHATPPAPAAEATPSQEPPPAAPQTIAEDAAVAASTAEPPAPTPPAPSPPPDTSGDTGQIPMMPPNLPNRPQPPATKVVDFMRTYVPQTRRESTLERTLGVEVASWLGAFAMMGGILFFLKLAMDYQYIPYFTPLVRIALAIAAGAALVVHGLSLHKRQLEYLGGTMAGAGIASMMIALWGAYAGFDVPVLSQAAVFFLIPVVGLLGIYVGLRMRTVVMPILAFAEMYLSPLIISNNLDRSQPFLLYLLGVTAAAMLIAELKREWDLLRLLGYSAAWVWLIGWVTSDDAPAHAVLGMSMIAAFYMLFTWVMMSNLRRARFAPAPTDLMESDQATVWDSIAAVFSPISSAAAMLSFWVLFHRGEWPGLWAAAAAMSLFTGLLSRAVKTPRFTVVASAESAIFLAIAVGLCLSGWEIALAYAGIALIFGIYANAARSAFARVWMFVYLVLAACHIFAFDSADATLNATLFEAGNNGITAWMLLGWGTGMLALLLAWLSRPGKRRLEDGTTELLGAPWATVACIAASTVLVFVVNVRALNPGGPFTLAALVWICALILLLRSGALEEIQQAMETLIGVLLMLLTVKWFAYEGIFAQFGPTQGSVPLLNLFTLNGLFLGAAIMYLNPPRSDPVAGRRFVGWWLTVVGFLLANVQVLQTIDYFMTRTLPGLGSPELMKNVSLTALWAIWSCVMVGIGFSRKSPWIRYVALVLMAAAVVKIVLVDMANADELPRVVIFMLLGALLFLVSYFYSRHVREMAAKLETSGASAPGV